MYVTSDQLVEHTLRMLASPVPLLRFAEDRTRVIAWSDPWTTYATRAGQRCIHGLFDPTLRRIELFGCNAQCSDRDLTHALLHELAHAGGIRREAGANEFARSCLERLGPRSARQVAQAIRSVAQPRSAVAHRPDRFCPLSIGP
jgi:hypothetical protein